MLSLKKSDIETISNILLELYAVSDIRQLEESFLADIRALIPYNQSSFQTIKACDDNVAIEDATFVDVDEHMLPLFNDIKTEKDYFKKFLSLQQADRLSGFRYFRRRYPGKK